MNHAWVSIACHFVGAAAVVYLFLLIRPLKSLAIAGRVLLGTALVLHGAALGQALLHQGGTLQGMAQGLSTAAFVLLVLFFYVDLRRSLSVLGAFVLPLALTLLVPSLLMQSVPLISTAARRPLLPVHIAIALVGVSALALAAAVALLYLLMERQMKGKKFGLLFSRLPPLAFLDELNRQLVVLGFVALSFTLVTGAFFSNNAPGFFWSWQPKEVATLFAWVMFASVLAARIFAGWRGWRAAMLTVAGFGLVAVSFLSSYPNARG